MKYTLSSFSGLSTIGYRVRAGGTTGSRSSATEVTAGVYETADITASPPYTVIWDDNGVVLASEDVPTKANVITVQQAPAIIVTET